MVGLVGSTLLFYVSRCLGTPIEELFFIKKHHSNGCLCLYHVSNGISINRQSSSIAACPSFLGVFCTVLMMAGVKSTRKVNPKMTRRARKTVRFNPERVTENKRKPRKTTPKKPSSPRRGAVGSPRGAVGSPRGAVGSPRGAVGSPRGADGSPRGAGLLRAGPQRNGPLLKPSSTIQRKTNRTKRVSNIARSSEYK